MTESPAPTPSEAVLLGAPPFADARGPSPHMVALVCLVAVAALLTVAVSGDLRRALQSRSWPSVRGVVVDSRVVSASPATPPRRFNARVTYEYLDGGRRTTADRVRFGDASTSDSTAARREVQRYPAGTAVAVRVDPSRPGSSVLEPGPTRRLYLLPALALGLTLFFAGHLGWHLWRLRRGLPPASKADPELPGSGRMARPLVIRAVRAALLGLEQAGELHLTLSAEGSADGSVQARAAPGRSRLSWPVDTLEGRIWSGRPGSVEDLVFGWLAAQSHRPWTRAREQLQVLAVLRGHAVVRPVGRDRLRYRRSNPTSEPPARVSDEVTHLLAECAARRPELWAALESATTRAVARRTLPRAGPGSLVSEPSPWEFESASARAAHLPGGAAARQAPAWLYLAVGIGAVFVARFFAGLSVGRDGALGVGMVWLGLVGAGALGLPPVPWLARHLERALPDDDPSDDPADPADSAEEAAAEMTAAQRVGCAASAVPVLTAITLALMAHPASGRVLMFLVPLGLGALALRLAQRRMAARVSEFVAPEPDVPPLRRARDESRPEAEASIEWHIVGPESVPAASSRALERQARIDGRAVAVHRVYRNAILAVSAATSALYLGFWRLTPGAAAPVSPGMVLVALTATAVLATRLGRRVTLGLLAMLGVALLFGGDGDLDLADEYDEWERRRIRPVGLPLLGAVWLAGALLAVVAYAHHAHSPLLALGFGAASLTTAGGYVHLLGRALGEVERHRPYEPPFTLVALRVFGGGDMSHFMALTNGWQYLGVRQKLDGPDTVARKFGNLVTYYARGVESLVVTDREELDAALGGMARQPDLRLRFPFNSMQCNDRTWKEAVDRLLAGADVVVVDLAGLGGDNGGVAYELQRVVDTIDFDRVILLINGSTDLDVLERMLSGAWSGRAPDSPNRALPERGFRLFDTSLHPETDGGETRKPSPGRRLQGDDLVGLLHDAALPRRVPAAVDPVRDGYAVRWSRLPLPEPARRMGRWLFHLLSLAVALYALHEIGG